MNLHWKKIFLVLEREFLVRVKTKLFLISTLLVPFGFALFIGVTVAIQIWETDPVEVIVILDESQELAEEIQARAPSRYRINDARKLDELRDQILQGQIDGVLILSSELIEGRGEAELLYGGSGGLRLLSAIRSDVRDVVREERLARLDVSQEIRAVFESSVSLNSRKLTEEGIEVADNTAIFSAIGFIMGLIIFVALFSYGAILMRGVIEEKTSRIIEVIASSIRPMEILIGKILGITSVALLQFAIWVFLFFSVSVAAGPILASITSPTQQMTEMVDQETMSDVMQSNPELSGAISAAENTNISGGELPFDIPEIEFSLILYFFLYFILGYFLYASLFAAIGSAVDSETDSQQLMTPVMILIMFAYFFNVQVMQSPDTTLSIVVSLIPFFSPINMITRIAISEVPFWQIAISLSLLVVMIWGILMLSARIYQNGILSYGKKATFKDLLKWIRTSA